MKTCVDNFTFFEEYHSKKIFTKKAKLEELSNNISERLTGRKPVSEQSERASGYATDLLVRRRSRVTAKSGVYYIIIANMNKNLREIDRS